MIFRFAEMAPKDVYKLLTGFVIPRPIALVSTCDAEGRVNAAPFSFFNVFGEDPAVLVLGLEARSDGSLKDTARNIRTTGEFVVNLVDEAITESMNICAVDAPAGVSEADLAGLTSVPSTLVAAPRLAQSPVSLECRLMQVIVCGGNRNLILGEIHLMHVRDGLVEPDSLRLVPEAYSPIGRLFGPWYARQGDRFEMTRPSWADLSRKQDQDA